jgi:hypothetical protein
MEEVRLFVDYGDYFAVECAELKQASEKLTDESKWVPEWHQSKQPTDNWQNVAKFLEEEKTDPNFGRTRIDSEGKETRIEFPYTDSVRRTARLLKTTPGHIEYIINCYAERNRLCRLGIKAMIERCAWFQLAQKLLWDIESVRVVFARRESTKTKLLQTLVQIRNKYFAVCRIDETGELEIVLSELSHRRSQLRVKRQESRMRGGGTVDEADVVMLPEDEEILLEDEEILLEDEEILLEDEEILLEDEEQDLASRKGREQVREEEQEEDGFVKISKDHGFGLLGEE